MPISDYNRTASNNGVVLGVNIGEGCQPANLNDAQRQVMADLALERDRASGDQNALGQGAFALPRGTVIMWTGSASDVPPGYALCDGSNGTPNLTGHFIRAGNSSGVTGGQNTVTLAATNIPELAARVSGTLSGSTGPAGAWTKSIWVSDNSTQRRGLEGYAAQGASKTKVSLSARDHVHSVSVNGTLNGTANVGSPVHAVENRPLFYTICFIMKL